MSGEPSRTSADTKDDVLLMVGMALWLVAVVARWPTGLSFIDEVAYLGQAKLLLEGHMRPLADSPGVWSDGPFGPVARYPYLVPILISPLVAMAPRLVFVTGVTSALMITWVASRALRAWGRRGIWALVVLTHPSVVLFARTIMVDLILSAFAVGAWWAMRNHRRFATVILLVLVIGSKAVGAPIAAALVAGECIRLIRPLLARERDAISHLAWAVGGVILGLILALALNLMSSGKLWYGYDHQSGPLFATQYFTASASRHAVTVLLLPPLLIVGIWALGKRREFGPLMLITVFTAMMCFYYFVDSGRVWMETLILGPRLILPVVVFLLIGYADVLAGLASRISPSRIAFTPVLVLAPAAIAFGVSLKHSNWQEPGHVAGRAAAAITEELGVSELGLTYSAFKAGMLYSGRTAWAKGHGDAKVVLCSKRSPSYREGEHAVSCDVPGYDTRIDNDGFRVLVRRTP